MQGVSEFSQGISEKSQGVFPKTVGIITMNTWTTDSPEFVSKSYPNDVGIYRPQQVTPARMTDL